MMKMIMISMMLSSPVMMMSMDSWILIWTMLEISSVSFISVMKSKYKNEGILMYYLAQSIGSFMILFSMMQEKNIISSILIMKTIATMGMFTKLGIMPFHQWFIFMATEIEPLYLFMISTIQKAAPLILMYWISMDMKTLTLLMLSMIASLFLQLTQKFLKKLLVYSSIFQTTWMLIIMSISKTITFMYYTIYTVIMFMLIMNMKNTNIFMLTEEKMSSCFMINMSSLAGIPPFLGFIPKWLMSKTMVKESVMLFLLLVMIMSSVMSIFIYLRFFFKMWMKVKHQHVKELKFLTTLIIQIITPISLLMML